MKKISIELTVVLASISLMIFACGPTKNQISNDVALKDALKGKFYFGVAMDSNQIMEGDEKANEIILKHFNSIVAENCMKSEKIQPEEGKFDFDLPDKFVAYGQRHNMHIVGHVLIWHSQAPKWFFMDNNGKQVSREVLIQRMKTHITELIGRYKGKVHGWDVINEAIEDDGSWRKSKFYEIIGPEYVNLAFQFAQEADPETELYYNDYSMAKPGRRDSVVALVKNLQARGIKIDGIGMQGHLSMDYPPVEEFEKSIIAFSELGVKVMITELDLTTIPFPLERATAEVSQKAGYKAHFDPYAKGLPDSAAQVIHDRYLSFFKLFLKHQDKISRVNMWGVHDAQSWRNNWPIRGRTDFPLLFDRQYKPKPIVKSIINEALKK
jgi:endo-1,4-beta-xylanase